MRTPLWLTPLLLSAALAVSACTAVPTAPAAAPAEARPAAEAPAAEGAYAGVDPSGQTVVWWPPALWLARGRALGTDRRVQYDQ
jgi:hypothetical protein